MALKSTIFKIELQVADLDRNYYQTHALTIARHPSETDERMMVRVIAFALNAHPALEFGKGLSTDEEPDLWRKDLTGAVEQWIEVGLPDERRIRRACGRAAEVIVYTYGGRTAELWWSQNRSQLLKQDRLTVIDLPQAQTEALAQHVVRTMQMNCTLQDGELWCLIDGASVNLVPAIRSR